jgi:hypothetical protein
LFDRIDRHSCEIDTEQVGEAARCERGDDIDLARYRCGASNAYCLDIL